MFTKLFTSFCRKCFSRRGQSARRHLSRKPVSCRLKVENLEDRLMPAAITFGGLEFMTTGNFVTTGHQVSTTAAVQVGLKAKTAAAFAPVLSLDGGIQFMNNDKTGTFTTNGSVSGITDDSGIIRLLDAHAHTFKAPALASNAGFTLPSTDTNVTTVGLEGGRFTVVNLAVAPKELDLRGSLSFAQLPGLSLPFTGANHVSIDTTGAHVKAPDITVANETFTSNDVQLTLGKDQVQYDSARQEFEISGTATLFDGTNHVGISLGSVNSPGLSISDGFLETSNGAAIIAPLFNLESQFQMGQILESGFNATDLQVAQALAGAEWKDVAAADVLKTDFNDTATRVAKILQGVYNDSLQQVVNVLELVGYSALDAAQVLFSVFNIPDATTAGAILEAASYNSNDVGSAVLNVYGTATATAPAP